MSSGGSGMPSKRLQRILTYGVVVFGLVPVALGLLLLFIWGGAASSAFLTVYYVFAILGLAVIAFEQMMNEIRRRPGS